MSDKLLCNAMFVITHKHIEQKIVAQGYHYISVGKHDFACEFMDSTEDNISEKNANYCELTGLYWLWKNLDICEVGLCHYRRFFCEKKGSQFDVLSIDKLSELLKSGDIVLPRAINLNMDYYTYYEKCLRNNALRECCNYLIDKDPSYQNAVKACLKKKSNHCFNMFYCKKELIDEYCSWLFDLLFSFEKMIDISEWNTQQQRVYGYLAEFLFNVWVERKQLKIVEVDAAQTETFPAPLSADANVIPAGPLKVAVYKILPNIWPIMSPILVEKTKFRK